MGMTKDEFLKAQTEARLERPGAKAQLQGLLRDAVAIERLTGSEDWDRFLSWMSGALEAVRAAKVGAAATLTNPQVVAQDALMRAKLIWSELDGHERCLEWVMELPKRLREGATEARELLKDSER